MEVVKLRCMYVRLRPSLELIFPMNFNSVEPRFMLVERTVEAVHLYSLLQKKGYGKLWPTVKKNQI